MRVKSDEDHDATMQYEELGIGAAPTAEPGLWRDVRAEFGDGFVPPIGVMYHNIVYKNQIPHAAHILRWAQYGVGPALAALAKRDPKAFVQTVHRDEGGVGRSCLIGAALAGYWHIASDAGDVGGALADRYAGAVVALLAGGAPSRATVPISLWGAWPVVERVAALTGIRLRGWASEDYVSRCWAAWEQARAGALAGERVAVVA